MNKYSKYTANVWLAASPDEYERGDTIEVTTKRGKVNLHDVHNLVYSKDGINYYSITRQDGTNAQTHAEKKANKYLGWSDSAVKKSNEFYQNSCKNDDFLVLGEPIKIGHHSERRHREMFEDKDRNMRKSIEQKEKADNHKRKAAYWLSQAEKVNLSMPESIEYFKAALDEAIETHSKIKSGEMPKDHAYSLTYAKKLVNELTNKYELALRLWSVDGLKETTKEKKAREKRDKDKEKRDALKLAIEKYNVVIGFNREQLKSAMNPDVKYSSIGAGYYVPSDNVDKFLDAIK